MTANMSFSYLVIRFSVSRLSSAAAATLPPPPPPIPQAKRAVPAARDARPVPFALQAALRRKGGGLLGEISSYRSTHPRNVSPALPLTNPPQSSGCEKHKETTTPSGRHSRTTQKSRHTIAVNPGSANTTTSLLLPPLDRVCCS